MLCVTERKPQPVIESIKGDWNPSRFKVSGEASASYIHTEDYRLLHSQTLHSFEKASGHLL